MRIVCAVMVCLGISSLQGCEGAGGIVNSALDFQRYMLDSVMSENQNFFPEDGNGNWGSLAARESPPVTEQKGESAKRAGD